MKACLRCFARLPGATCPACGFVNRRYDRRIYWNRHPGFRRAESVLKALVCVLVFGAVLWLALEFRTGGAAAGYLYALPLVLGRQLWQTASKLTRHVRAHRPVFVYSTAFGLTSLCAFLLGAWRASALLALAVFLVLVLARYCEARKRELLSRIGTP